MSKQASVHKRSVSAANTSRRAKVEAKKKAQAKGENTRKTRGNIRLERFTQRYKDKLNTESYTGTIYTKNYTGNKAQVELIRAGQTIKQVGRHMRQEAV